MRTRLLRFAALISAIWTFVALAFAGGAGVTGW
jgi:nitrate reductase NapE component